MKLILPVGISLMVIWVHPEFSPAYCEPFLLVFQGIVFWCKLLQLFQIPKWLYCQQRVTILVRTPARNPYLEGYRPCHPGYLLIMM
jgi:hypothetical protein